MKQTTYYIWFNFYCIFRLFNGKRSQQSNKSSMKRHPNKSINVWVYYGWNVDNINIVRHSHKTIIFKCNISETTSSFFSVKWASSNKNACVYDSQIRNEFKCTTMQVYVNLIWSFYSSTCTYCFFFNNDNCRQYNSVKFWF